MAKICALLSAPFSNFITRRFNHNLTLLASKHNLELMHILADITITQKRRKLSLWSEWRPFWKIVRFSYFGKELKFENFYNIKAYIRVLKTTGIIGLCWHNFLQLHIIFAEHVAVLCERWRPYWKLPYFVYNW